MERSGIPALRTREPGGSAGAEAIRELLLDGADERWDAMTEVLLLNAARRDHVMRLIRPALERGLWVVCDRFLDSTIAYQGYGRGVAIADLMAAHRLAVGDFVPDLTLILDLPVADGLARAAGRGAPSTTASSGSTVPFTSGCAPDFGRSPPNIPGAAC